MKNSFWKKTGAASLLALMMLSLAVAAYASGDVAIPREKWLDLLWRTTNFAGLAFILIFFLKKPFADGLNGRREGIKDQLEALESRKAEAERMYKEAEGKLAGSMKRLTPSSPRQLNRVRMRKQRSLRMPSAMPGI